MPLSVVLADDDAHITCVVAARLEAAGFQVSVARDGEEALELARRLVPSLIITDLQMPRMSGLELAVKLREDARTMDIPLIMLSARGYLADDAQIARTNIKRILAKPFSAREVVRLATDITSTATGEAA